MAKAQIFCFLSTHDGAPGPAYAMDHKGKILVTRWIEKEEDMTNSFAAPDAEKIYRKHYQDEYELRLITVEEQKYLRAVKERQYLRAFEQALKANSNVAPEVANKGQLDR